MYHAIALGLLALAVISTGCAPANTSPIYQTNASPTPPVSYTAPGYGDITPGPKKLLPDLSTVIEVPPFPYSAPLPPLERTVLDGLYSRRIPLNGTPTPCRRCAGYRLEGGLWTLYLDRGVFKVFQRESEFQSVGSFSVIGNRITFFNDPYCEEDLTMSGTYDWELDGRGALSFKNQGDACSIGLRAKNLTATPWTKTPISPEERNAACQPPTHEAAITDHWSKPPYCEQH